MYPIIMMLSLITVCPNCIGSASSSINANCPLNCTCNDETLSVVCSRVNLSEVPITLNPSMERLILKHNKIKTVDAASFQFYRALKYVDLFDNQLIKIPSNAFEIQSKLVELHLNQNKISALSDKAFNGLISLTVLNMRDNYLELLPDKILRNLQHLEELDLGQNRLGAVAPATFEGLLHLRVLHLDDNQLTSMPSASFGHLNNLAELRIGMNSFPYLADDCFRGLDHLTLLDLDGPGLKNISEHAFRGLATLRSLTLADNHLFAIPTKSLSRLVRLEELSIGQNAYSAITRDSLFGLSNLRKLDASGNVNLVSLENGAFSGNLNIETLTFTSNKNFNTIEPGALSGLPNLKELILRDNAFTSFSENLVAWPELRKIDLSDNPLVCDCSLLWLKELLLQRNYSTVVCYDPSPVRGRSLKSLTEHDLGCELYPSGRQTLIGALCGAGLALIALLLILLCRYRHKLCDMFKNYRKKKQNKLNGKQSEYQKTFNEEEFIIRAAHHHQSLKPIPVTEL